jgi:hypothetical protein
LYIFYVESGRPSKGKSKLPPWHRGKGDKGWIFVDEVFLN